jgi:hypothetical protein
MPIPVDFHPLLLAREDHRNGYPANAKNAEQTDHRPKVIRLLKMSVNQHNARSFNNDIED